MTRRRLEILVFALVLLASLSAAVAIGSSAETGLSGRFWRNTDWAGAPAGEFRGSLPDTDHFIRGVPAAASTGGSAEWTGVLFVDRPGDYEFEVASDDGAWLFIADALVVDNGGDHARLAATGRVMLAQGAQPIRIRYYQRGGDMALDVYWSGPGLGRHLLRAHELAPGPALRGSSSWRAFVRAMAVGVPILWALLLMYLPARLCGAWLWSQVRAVAPDPRDRRSLVMVLLVALGLMGWGLDWGLDGFWAPDELSPALVRELIQRRFGDGWYDKYPVMHYAVVGIPVSAFELASRAGLLPPGSFSTHMAPLALMRAVSLGMGLGMLVAAFLCAAELYGPRRAALASWALLLTGLTVFYGKVANLDVPFMCWFGLAMLGFVRIWKTNRTRDYVLLGVAAAAAVATKDQAYASLALLPIAVVAAGARASASLPSPPAWRRFAAALVDRRLLAGGAASLVTFAVCHNAVFNLGGVVNHFRLLSTLGDLAIVPRTAGGYAHLTLLTGELFRFALGWPLLVAALAGVAAAAWHKERRSWLWLLLVPLSFHVTFTFVTLYVNDRYLFGGVFVAALFAGSAMGDALDRLRPRVVGRAVVAGILGYSLLHASSVNVMMHRDARHEVRLRLEARADEGDRVGLIGSYMPTFGPSLRTLRLQAWPASITDAIPEWLVLNQRFASRYEYERSPLGRNLLSGLADGSLGYVEEFRYRGPVPAWAILQFDPQFLSPRESAWTNLDKINPEMVVYRRR